MNRLESRWPGQTGRLTFGLLLSLILPLVGLVEPVQARADDAKPVKKDSSTRVRPKEATFTTSVTPSTAKPGDLVTYQVKAKIAPPWHIYKYAKTPLDNGPRLTEFDFFDTAGLKPEKGWNASPAPIRKQEPAFPEIPYLEYHEDEVVWSQQLRVPTDAASGTVKLQCQIGYMICSDQNCSFPGQWTLPPAVLTIKGAGGPSSLRLQDRPTVRFASYQPDDPAATEAKPAKKDSRIPQPKTIHFTTEIVPTEAKAGDTVQLKLTAKLDEGWHIFQYSKVDQPGPNPLKIDNFDLAGLQPAGDWTSSRPPTRKKDPMFADIEALEFFEGDVTWSLPLLVPPGTAAGSKSLQVQASYQICSSSSCSAPGRWTMPAVAFTVAPGGVVASATAVPTPPTANSSLDPIGVEVKNSTVTVTPTVSEIEKTAKSGLIPFLLACAGAGLLALAMPCVWPMIPVTVNFFVKQGEQNGGRATGLAITYCLAIIGIFTAIGVLFSALLGASSLSNLANNPWLNTTVALLFFAFGLSLLGLFEIRLPNFLLNASSQGESRGGIVGVMFMATTLTITSFTCTFPVVGGLLVLAAGGSYFYPVLGLATFASVVALPFFLLALAPGLLKKMPKSGDWMNTVKVVGGLVELAAAFKFVNTAEIGFHSVPEAAWVDEQTLLTIWVVIAFVCGVYLLGFFQTDHDQKEVKVGPGRMIFGAGFLVLALYLAPALFGKPPTGQIFNQLVVGLLPPQGSETKATSSDPVVALTQEKSKHGVVWGMSYEAALAEARSANKRILIDFTGVNCSNCRQMERSVMPRNEVVASMEKFVTVQLYTDFVPIDSITQEQREDLAEQNIMREIKMTGETTAPFYVIVDPSGGAEKVVATHGGYAAPAAFLGFMAKGATSDQTLKVVAAEDQKQTPSTE